MIQLNQDEVRFVKTQLRKDLQTGNLKAVVSKLAKEDKDKRIFMFLLEHDIPLFRAFERIPSNFFDNTDISSIVIPKNIKSIERSAFLDCTHLSRVVIENGVKKIGDHAFKGCQALVKIDIPESVVSLGKGSFSGCVSLKEVVLPDSITILPNGLFDGADNVTIYANSRKDLSRGMKLRCPKNEVAFYQEHLKMKVD